MTHSTIPVAGPAAIPAAVPTATRPVPAGQRALGWAAAAGTLPYLTLKTLWLTGSTAGAADPAFLRDPAIHALNIATLAMDLAVIGLALALTHRWGERLPAWLVLLPTWVGTGFLVPMALAVLPATVIGLTGGAGPANDALEPWVQPMVYGGFAWQGVFLVAAFAGHAHRRWSATVTVPAPPSRSLAPVLRVLTGGGVVTAVLSAVLHLAAGVGAGDAPTVAVRSVDAALALAAAAGVLALVRGRAAHRWVAATAAWTGSAAMFSWGLWAVVTTMAVSPLGGGGQPVVGMAQVSGLLSGFALAVAGLLALAGTGVARPGDPASRVGR